MKPRKSVEEMRKFMEPLDDVIAERMKDPEYRRWHMVYYVRVGLATLVKQLRLEKKMTQKQLALRSGLPQSQIARLEGVKDERIPGLEQLGRIFSALGQSAVLSVRPKAPAKGEARDVALV